MGTYFNEKRRWIALIIMVVFLFSSLFANVQAEEGKVFNEINAAAASGTDDRQSDVNGSDFVITRNGETALSHSSNINNIQVSGTKCTSTSGDVPPMEQKTLTVENEANPENGVGLIYDPIEDSLFTDGVLNLSQVYTSTEQQVTTIGQVVTKYGSNGKLDSIIIEDVIDNEIVGLLINDKTNINTNQYQTGDIIKITGNRSSYAGAVQLASPTVEILQTNQEVIQPQVMTIQQLMDGKDKYLSEYVLIKNVTLGAYNSNKIDITDETGKTTIYQGASYNGVSEGDVVDVYGVWSKYNTSYQLRVGDSDCYHKQGSYTVDESITLPLVSWGGTSKTGYSNTVIYGDLIEANDQKDTTAKLTISTDEISQYENTGDGDTQYFIGSTGLSEGQYYQMTFSTKGYGNVNLNFTMRGSNTGAKYFKVLYSTDGVNFTESDKISYTITTDNETETMKKEYKDENQVEVTEKNVDYYVELPSSLNHCDQVYVRLQVASMVSIEDETITSGGVNQFFYINCTANPIISDDMCQMVTITPDAGAIILNQELTMKTGTADADIFYMIDDGEYVLYDSSQKPVLQNLPATIRVYAKKEGKENSVIATYGYTQAKVASVKASPNGGAVKNNTVVTLTCATENAKIEYSMDDGATWNEYIDSFKLTSLPAKVQMKATREGYIESEISSALFTKLLNDEYNIYFGQIHSHTDYSDGAGTCEQAFEYASTKAKNIDFLAVTDHSNSFDNDTSVTIKDGSASSEWVEGHKLADKYTNTTDSENPFVGIYGYEMTWSGGAPGHMNTYNTDGFLSRNIEGYKNASQQSLPNYYEQLKTVPESISMFNHPGTTFGDFYDFGFYDEGIDRLITLIEVGNGEETIGNSGYMSSYKYYTRALDKGWHVAPANNQDNHKGKWGDANTGRTVILADSLTRDNIFDAIRNMRTYATEDDDLKIWYTLNGSDLGTIFEEVPDKVDIQVKLEDPTDSSIGKVDVIVNGGLTVASSSLNENQGAVSFHLSPDYSYYYIRVTQTDGDIAVTAPVWLSKVESVGISSIKTSASLAVKDEPIDITTSFFNNEDKEFQVDSIVYTINGKVIHTTDVNEAGLTAIESEKTASDTFMYTHSGLGKTNIMVTLIGRLDGVTQQYYSILQLNYVSEDMVTKVLVDGTHNNDYVSGYYGGNVSNFADLASQDYVQVSVVTDQFTSEMLEDCSLLIISAPAKKSGEYNNKTYDISHFEDDFIQMVKDYVDHGGKLIVCGLADYQDSADCQSSTEINKLLSAIGSSMRLNSDEMVDDAQNCGQNYRLNYDDFNKESQYLQGVTDEQKYYVYSGCSILLAPDKVADGTSEALVYGHDTTYSINSRLSDSNYRECEKGSIVALAHERLSSGSDVFAAGTVFLSNHEVKTDLDNANESYYANRNILLNILREVKKEIPVSTIKEMRNGNAGEVYAVEGWVTAGTSKEGNTFFDTIYIQDETAGTAVFPIADKGIEIGTKIRIVGFVDEYQDDKIIQAIEYKILDGKNLNVIDPAPVTTIQAADYNTYGGSLLKVTGKVTKIVKRSKGVDYFYLMDDSQTEVRVFIDGYILASGGSDAVNDDVKVGNEVSVIGLSYMNPDGTCLRVRDRAEIVLVKEVSQLPTDPTDPIQALAYLQAVCNTVYEEETDYTTDSYNNYIAVQREAKTLLDTEDKSQYTASQIMELTDRLNTAQTNLVIATGTITVSSSITPDTVLQISGSGRYAQNDQVTLTTQAILGYNFLGWYKEDTDQKVCNSLTYSFTFDHEKSGGYIAKYMELKKSQVTVTVKDDNLTITPLDEESGNTHTYRNGTQVTVCDNNPGEQFAYWENEYGMILSRQQTYTFTVTGPTTLTAVYNTVSEDGKAIITYESAYGQVIYRTELSEEEVDTSLHIPVGPVKYGYTFTGWSMDEDEIKAEIAKGIDTITISPVYELKQETYSITVNNGTGTGTYSMNNVVTAVANDSESGQKFSHWIDETNTILSYSKSYQFFAVKNMTITAVYVDDISVVEAMGTTDIIDVVKDTENGKITFVSMSSVPEGCKIEKAGVIATNDEVLGTSDGDFNESTASYVRGSAWAGNEVRYTWTKNITETNQMWYVRAYLVYRDNNGNMQTVYGNIVSASLSEQERSEIN